MKRYVLLVLFSITLIFFSCNNTKNKVIEGIQLDETLEEPVVNKDSIVFSFSFVGCNRVDRGKDSYIWKSTANQPVLKRIIDSIVAAKRQDELFFFLGDLVLGETNIDSLDKQLNAWVKFYDDSLNLKNTKTKLVAISGNHEMLKYVDDLDAELPLVGATDTWLKYMGKYMPSNRETAPDSDSLDNRLTFSFTQNNIAFIVMNTDSFYPYPYTHKVKTDGYGTEEGRIPTDWITNKIAHYQSLDSIDHIFVLGHKPYYVGTNLAHGHDKIIGGAKVWDAMKDADKAIAMLSAHKHEYILSQMPANDGPYQVVAGQGGSTWPQFFGYSTINIYGDNRVELVTKGFNVGSPYYSTTAKDTMTIRDQTFFTRK